MTRPFLSCTPHELYSKTPLRPSQLLCPICGKPVPLESAKTDEHGQSIHEDCYVLKLQLQDASS